MKIVVWRGQTRGVVLKNDVLEHTHKQPFSSKVWGRTQKSSNCHYTIMLGCCVRNSLSFFHLRDVWRWEFVKSIRHRWRRRIKCWIVIRKNTPKQKCGSAIPTRSRVTTPLGQTNESVRIQRSSSVRARRFHFWQHFPFLHQSVEAKLRCNLWFDEVIISSPRRLRLT